jgi:DNA-directed RNA polymerase sigma subunit (sigma70/sigma32)
MQWNTLSERELTSFNDNQHGRTQHTHTAPCPACGASTLVDRESLFLLHVRLIDLITRRYRGRGLAEDQLRTYAECGLRDAVATYQPAHGIAFSTHANWWIRQRLKEAILTAALRGSTPTAVAI